MASFEEALTAAKAGKRIRVPSRRQWIYLDKKKNKLISDSNDYGYTSWIPHQWEILAMDWIIE